ncbi:hypothetical protein AALB51_04450 [Lachnospiraceae bacterium 62-26]
MYVSKYFNLGNVAFTNGIHETMMENRRFALEIDLSLQRYCIKDWGNLSEEDKRTNDEALEDPDNLYILAAYQTCEGRVYIITNRISENPGDNVTIVCFPDER